ncbi:MAG: S-layer homology domain-containing protein [Acutalibacter sp.]|nr:S-layer homology domain-containing protein [Acutalibacter sp.]
MKVLLIGNSPFPDVKESAWYAKAVIWAESKDVVKGCGDGLYGPNDPITRGQLAAILYGYEDGTLRPKGNTTRAEAASMIMRYLEKREKEK